MFTDLLRKTTLAAGLLGVLACAGVAQQAGTSGGGNSTRRDVTVRVNGSVDQVVDRLQKLVADNGMMVMGELHQGEILAMTGLRVKSETLFIGNPNIGKQLFSEEPGVGLFVPIRINVHEGGPGYSFLRYTWPSLQLRAFDNPKVNEIGSMLDQKLYNLTKMVLQ